MDSICLKQQTQCSTAALWGRTVFSSVFWASTKRVSFVFAFLHFALVKFRRDLSRWLSSLSRINSSRNLQFLSKKQSAKKFSITFSARLSHHRFSIRVLSMHGFFELLILIISDNLSKSLELLEWPSLRFRSLKISKLWLKKFGRFYIYLYAGGKFVPQTNRRL